MKVSVVLILCLAIFQHVSAVCNVCNNNGAACKSDTEFHLCEKGRPNTSKMYSCSTGKICTKFNAICMEKTAVNAVPACGDTSNCGKCEGEASDGIYTCTSRTTYTMCLGGVLTDIRDSCPENQMCDVNVGKTGEIPCVPDCKELEIVFCDRNDPIDDPAVTTTILPATTTSTKFPQPTTKESKETITELLTTTSEKLSTTTIERKTTTGSIQTAVTTATSNAETTELPTTTTVAVPIATTKEPNSQTATTENINTTQEETSTTTIFSPTPLPTTKTKITTTQLPTTTVNPAEVFCSKQIAAGRYPYPNDATCQNYIYCFPKGDVMQATHLKCQKNHYFNSTSTLCEKNKPQGCT